MAQRASWVPATHSTPDKRRPLFFSSACFRSSISGQGQAGDCVKTAGTKPTDLGPAEHPTMWGIGRAAATGTGRGEAAGTSAATDEGTRLATPGEHFLAGSFAVCQKDEVGDLKVRRAEDWCTTCRLTTSAAASWTWPGGWRRTRRTSSSLATTSSTRTGSGRSGRGGQQLLRGLLLLATGHYVDD